MEEANRKENKWRWFVVAGSHLAQALSVGASCVLGVMLNAWVYDFGATVQEISTVIALTPICVGVGSFVAGLLCGRLGYRMVGIVGGIVTSLGFLATSFAQSVTHLYIFLGFLTSFGVGLCHTPSIMVLGSYFPPERLILANGISFAGLSTGSLVLPPLLEYLYNNYGWRRGTFVLAAIKMNLMVCGALYRPISKGKTKKWISEKPTTKDECISQTNVASGPPLYKNAHYILSLFVVFLVALVAFGGNVFVIPRATRAGIPPMTAALLVTFIGVSGAIGGLGHSFLITRKYLTTETMFCISTLTCALSLFTNTLSDHLAFLIVNICIFAVTLSVVTSLISNPIPRMIVCQSTPSLADPAIGIVLFTSAFGQTVGMMFAGMLHDVSGSFTVPYLAFGLFLCMATLLFVPIFRLMRDIDGAQKVAIDHV